MHTTCQHHAKLFNLQNSHRISILFPISPSTRPPPQATELTHLPNTNPMRAKDTGHRDDSLSPSLPICQVKTGQGFKAITPAGRTVQSQSIASGRLFTLDLKCKATRWERTADHSLQQSPRTWKGLQNETSGLLALPSDVWCMVLLSQSEASLCAEVKVGSRPRALIPPDSQENVTKYILAVTK